MAIALGGDQDFIAFCGFASLDLIKKNLRENLVIASALGHNSEEEESKENDVHINT